jgi:acyl transferase domain-containing protein/NADPH:quinone reductase-like Zn-dependent oxidoreductase
MIVVLTNKAEMKSLDNINRPEYSQPLCTAIQIGLVELLRSVNIEASVVVGHSSGEIAAAYTIGALTLSSACRVAYYRGLLAGKLVATATKPGAMLSVNLPKDEVADYITQHYPAPEKRPAITIACVNSPLNVTLSGLETDLDALETKLRADKIFAVKLRTGIAYHSPEMEAVSSEYLELMGQLQQSELKPSSAHMVSSVTGRAVDPSVLSQGQYWVSNLVSPVRFSEALQSTVSATTKKRLGSAASKTIYDLIEVGPHAALRRPCMDTVDSTSRKKDVRYNSVLFKQKSATVAFLELVGRMYARGYPVSVTRANAKRLSDTQDHHPFLVDTPQYPFNHSQRYWNESRASYDYRMRSPAPRDVLGVQASDWNPLQPKWRKVINVDETPWVVDHQVNKSILFPATGMLVMALEAAKQVAQKDRPIMAYYIKEATFISPIVLRSSDEGGDRVETMTMLRPIWKPYEKESVWSEIWICTYHSGTWTECFRATIQTQYQEKQTPVDGGKEHALGQEAAVAAYAEALDACTTSISSEKFYEYCGDRGLTYGDSFRILKDVRWDGQHNTVAYVDVSQPSAQYAGLVHPAVIDAAAQIFWVAPSRGLSEPMPTEVPHRVFDAYIAAAGWQTPQTLSVRILVKSRYRDVGTGVTGSISCYADDGTLLCKVNKMEMDPIANDDLAETADKKLLYGIEWEPSLHAMTPSQLQTYCRVDEYTHDEGIETEYLKRLNKAVYSTISATLVGVSTETRASLQPHFRTYVSWMEQQVDRYSNTFDHALDSNELEHLLSEIEETKPAWKMFSAVARTLPSILRGTTDPLTLLFSTDLAETFYNDIFAQLCATERFKSLMKLACHQQPELRILEVGAGTGGFTSYVLAALQQRELQTGGTCFAEYTYTDLSHGFFENAKKKFYRFGERMSFKAVDLESEITVQGIDAYSYDIVIAGSVLHTTATLSTTLQHLHKALKPSGKLVVFELTKPDALAMNFGFGIFPGWWIGSESWRADGPAVDEGRWHQLLQDNSFSGNDLVLRDYKSDMCHNFSIIVSTAEKLLEQHAPSTRILFVYGTEPQHSKPVVDAIEALLHQATNHKLDTVCWEDLSGANVTPEDIVVFLPEMTGSIFTKISSPTFDLLKATIHQTKRLLWVCATDIQDPTYPFSGTTNGFLRTMRSENISKQIVTLVLEGIAHDADQCARHITTVLQQAFEQQLPEVEYVVRGEQLLTGRLIEEIAVNETIHATLQPRLVSEPWGQGPAVMFNVRKPGTLDTLEFVKDAVQIANSDLGPHELEVEAHAWGVNFRDIFMALGRLEEDDYGFDCGGVVRKVGSECTTVQPGDRVIVAVIGCMRGMVRCQELEVTKLPESFDLNDTVAATAPGITVYHSLVDTARLQKGERILIHSATGATGQVAVQLAQHIGAEVYATVGTDEKKAFLMETYHIPEDHIFYSRNASFAQGVMRKTNNEGVHVVLNSLSGDSLRASWECMAAYGRFIELGKVDIKSNSGLPMSGFARNCSFTAVDLHHVSSTRKEITQHLLSKTMGLLEKGIIRCPAPVHVYPVSQMEEAFRFFQTGKSTGRTVISVSPKDVVPVCLLTGYDGAS